MKKITPYNIFENDYWSQPRDVCVAEEINYLKGGDCEIICGFQKEERNWIMSLAQQYRFVVTDRIDRTYENTLGIFMVYTITQRKNKRRLYEQNAT